MNSPVSACFGINLSPDVTFLTEKHRLAVEVDGAAPAQGPIFLRQANENRIVASWLQIDLPGECESLVRISIWQAKQFQVARQIATIIENLILIADFLQRDASHRTRGAGAPAG